MPRPLSYFKTRIRPAPDWIIPGWLKRQNTGLILGEPKRACKSWLSLNLAWELSDNKPLWGIHHSKKGYVFQPPKPLRTVYFTQEDTEDDIHDRIELLFSSGWQPNDRVWIVPKDLQMVLDNAAGIGVIQTELDYVVKNAGPIDLVIFDPMRRLHRGSENDSENIVAIWTELSKLHARYNCSTIFCHHMVKPPTTPNSRYDITSPYAGRGSGDIYGGGDAFINVKPIAQRGQPSMTRKLELHFETKRGRPLSPVSVKVNFETGQVSFDGFLQGREPEAPKSASVPKAICA